jgi:diadenosine tetraphosphate (Ap4A) HIT family hydrolase
MKPKPKIEQLSSYKEVPFPDENIVHEDENVVVYKDGFPVTEGHLLFIPKSRERRANITICFEYAYDWGVRGIRDYKWEGFNVGINQNECAGQSVLWPHVHMIPRRKGDTPNPRGGVRGVIPMNQDYAVPAPCSRTALVRDRYIDEIKTEMKGKRQGRGWDKVDDITWDKVVKRMKDKEKKRRENDNE